MRIREIFTEGVAETQDVLSISRSVIDYVIMNKDRFLNPTKAAGDISSNVIDLKDIPGLPKPTTPAGQTLINATRIKIVSPDVLHRNYPPGTRIRGDAAPYYTNPKGEYQGRAYPDARYSRMPDAWEKDLISAKGDFGDKLDIRLNAELLDVKNERQLQSTLTHELSHNLDTIKGMNTIQAHDNVRGRINDEERLARHKDQLALKAKGGTYNPDFILTPQEEKQLVGRLRKPMPQVPKTGSAGYYADVSELNARLMQSAELMAEHTERLRAFTGAYGSKEINEYIRWAMSVNSIPQAFVKYSSEAEFKASLTRKLTQAEWEQAMANPEFKKLYNRIFKFLNSEQQAGGIIAQAQKDNFKTWATTNATTRTSPKDTFISRFKQVVIDGLEAAKDVARVVTRKLIMTDQAIQQAIIKRAPEWLTKAGFKSIPLVGLVIGIGFAIPRLFKGDYTGAGLEVAGSVGSLLTQVPATAYQIARDLYNETYSDEQGAKVTLEQDMIDDPEGTTERLKELAGKIADLLRTGIANNAPQFPQAFKNTAGGAAVGYPKLAQQAARNKWAQDTYNTINDVDDSAYMAPAKMGQQPK